MRKIVIISLLSLLMPLGNLFSQRTFISHEPENIYREGVDLFLQEKYASCYDVMKIVGEHADNDLLAMNASFYRAASAARLLHKDAVALLKGFLGDYPESPFVNDAYFELANLYYSQKSWRDFLNICKTFKSYQFSSAQKNEIDFKKGYADFMLKNYADAKIYFSQLKNTDSKYVPLANYYYAFILYTEGNYKSSLDLFETLREDKNFGSIVPFYIIQIYYKLGYNDTVIAYGEELISKASPKRALEMSHLIGEAYYQEENYAKALPYFRQYFSKSAKTPSKEDNYLLAYTHYKLENYDTAAKHFTAVLSFGKEDLIAQNSLYHLGFCDVKLNKKFDALNAFKDAANLDIDGRITEDATYNYIKLSYELSFAPYNEPMKIIEKFLNDNPDSRYKSELTKYLADMYISTKNYASAYETLKNIKRKDVRLLDAQQRIAYNLGAELFRDEKFEESMPYFKDAILWDYDVKISNLAKYWTAEAAYRLGNFEAAKDSYLQFLSSAAAKSSSQYALANYGAGYAFFSLKDYKSAIKYFKVAASHNLNNTVLNDAYLRIADANYMTKNFNDAILNYDLAIALERPDMDYALMQKALCFGGQGKFSDKIRVLQDILKIEKSTLLPKAYYELASTYLIQDNNTKALEKFKYLSDNYLQTNYGKASLLKQGLIYFNQGKDTEALSVFEEVIDKFPNTVEAKEALASIRNVYIAMNKVDEFFSYTQKIGQKIENSEQDSISYQAAEKLYLDGDCNVAVKAFADYLTKFPAGIFATEASFYAADCQIQAGNGVAALPYFDKVIALPESFYTEPAMLSAAKIAMEQRDFVSALNRYQAIVEYSEKEKNIENAKIAIFRCQVELKNPNDIIAAAKEILKIKEIPEYLQEEAFLQISHSERQLNHAKEATEWIFKLLNSANNNYVAEAKYYKVEEIFAQKNHDESEKAIIDYISNYGSNYYFLAKVYILWGQIYFDRGNYLQASQTCQSVIDNYDGEDEVKLAARELLQQVIDKENQIKEAAEKLNKNEDFDDDLYIPDDEI